MARGALRGVGVAWLSLVALQVATTDRGSGALVSGLDGVTGLVRRAFSADVAAIPDLAHRTGRDEEPGTPTTAPARTEGTTAGTPAGYPPNRFPGLVAD